MSLFSRTFNDGNTKAQIVTTDGVARYSGAIMKGAALFTLGAVALSGAPLAAVGVLALFGYGVGALAQATGTRTVPAGESQFDVQRNDNGHGKRLLKFINPLKL